MKEHKIARTNGEPWTCTLAELAMNHQHNIAWEDATVVDANPAYTNVGAIEVWHIHQKPRPINRDRGLLPLVYNLLIKPH